MNRTLKLLAVFIAVVVIFTVSRHFISSTTTTTTTTTSTTTSTTTTTATTVGTTCTGSAFTGVFNQGQGAAGTIFASATLTKTTGGTCTVDGYPLLTLQDKTGAVISSRILDKSPVNFPDASANQPAQPITVHGGGSITFSLGYSDVQVGAQTCGSATTLNVQFTAGGSVVTVTPAYPVQPCNSNTVWVSPFY